MSQLQLFHPSEPEPVRYAEDLGFIRKCLQRQLRTVRNAEIMPWSAGEAELQERRFPELAALLPADEARDLTQRFHIELERLRLVG